MIRKITDQKLSSDSADGTGAALPAPIEYWKGGIMASSNDAVIDAWAAMNVPRRQIHKNCRFYFTEEGWKRYGRPTIAACQRTGQQYRVITIKEHSVDIVYRDEIQVAVRPRKKITKKET